MDFPQIIQPQEETDDINRVFAKTLLCQSELETLVARLLNVAPHDYLAFSLILQAGSTTPSELARLTCSNSSTTSMSLDRLESNGLIHRDRSDIDRRKVIVCPTAKAVQAIDECITPLQTRANAYMETLPEEHIEHVVAFLQTVNGYFGDVIQHMRETLNERDTEEPTKIVPNTK